MKTLLRVAGYILLGIACLLGFLFLTLLWLVMIWMFPGFYN